MTKIAVHCTVKQQQRWVFTTACRGLVCIN